jgi:hypothetical protein
VRCEQDGDFISRSKIAQPGIFHVASITERHATLRLRSNHRSKYLSSFAMGCNGGSSFDFFLSACPRSAPTCQASSPLSTSSCPDPQSTGFSLEQFIEFLPQQLGRPVCSSRNQVLEYSGSNPAFLPPCGCRSHRCRHRKEFPMEGPCHILAAALRTTGLIALVRANTNILSKCKGFLVGLRVGVLG